jgi:hypothetical protein
MTTGHGTKATLLNKENNEEQDKSLSPSVAALLITSKAFILF